MGSVRQIVLDTETTGLDPKQGHRIIEVGCIELIDRQVTENRFHCYINPEREVEAGALAVHGITDAFLADKPRFAEVAQQLRTYLEGAELIIHNAPFDVGFLDHEYRLFDTSLVPIADCCTIIDTLPLARRKHPGQRNSLDALCQRYEVDLSARELHGALLDAQLLADVYLRMTGGQTQLFDSGANEAKQESQQATISRLAADREPLPIIYADEEERRRHEELLGAMSEES